MTEVFFSENGALSDKDVLRCADIIKNGGTVAFPTETVYGIGANGLDEMAVEGLYKAKNRPPVKPISLCVADLESAQQVAVFDNRAKKLFTLFMPGPLTLVLPKRSVVPDVVTAGLDSVGIRVPLHPVALSLARKCGVPIALTSANLSGEVSPKDGDTVVKTLCGKADAIINGGRCEVGVESTIVSLVGEIKLLRQGAIPYETILEALK